MALPRINFYQINDDDSGSDDIIIFPFLLIVELLHQRYRLNQRIFIWCRNENQMLELDEQIWAFDGEHFLAHSIEGESSCGKSPIVLGTRYPQNMGGFACFINLTETPLLEKIKAQEIVEIVPSEEKEKQLARQRFKLYGQNGYQPTFQVLQEYSLKKVTQNE